ncbi:MAG: hypothetical protein ACLFRD_06130 [Nitriliruptoraceae bacterium]
MASNRVFGLILIAIGTALLLILTTDVGGEVIVGLLGIGFLIAYAFTRSYGYLVPGSILTGLGAGLVVAAQDGPDEAVVLGLGLGFLAIAVVNRGLGEAKAGWWWPLIPGGVLVIVGVSTLMGTLDLGRFVVPIALIVVGALLLLRGGGHDTRRSRRQGDGAEQA